MVGGLSFALVLVGVFALLGLYIVYRLVSGRRVHRDAADQGPLLKDEGTDEQRRSS